MDILIKLIIGISITSTTALAATSEASGIIEEFYKDAKGLSGYALKTALHKKLKETHRDKGYGALINVYFSSDADRTYDNDGSIVDMYSENPNRKDPYTFASKAKKCGSYKHEADCFNREHIFPQSAFHKRSPMRSDFFHVYSSN